MKGQGEMAPGIRKEESGMISGKKLFDISNKEK
jgi:hypothetical protein